MTDYYASRNLRNKRMHPIPAPQTRRDIVDIVCHINLLIYLLTCLHRRSQKFVLGGALLQTWSWSCRLESPAGCRAWAPVRSLGTKSFLVKNISCKFY